MVADKPVISVVVATHDQRERLQLVLTGLRGQSLVDAFEVVVVDDGSMDGTAALLAAWESSWVRVVRLAANRGRCVARNEGVRQARGELIVFLDGDALPHPGLLGAYWCAYVECGGCRYLQGYHFSLPGVEFYQDPQTGSLVEGPLLTQSLAVYLLAHRDELMVTDEQVLGGFGSIESRAVAGGYPTEANAAMQRSLREHLEGSDLAQAAWVGFVPHNAAVPAEVFRAVGGFDEQMPFSEGMDLAYRLQERGVFGRFVDEAKSYHLYHHHDFGSERGEPVRCRAIELMARKHGERRIRLVHLLYGHFWPEPLIPEAAVLRGFGELDSVLREADEDRLRALLRVVEVARPGTKGKAPEASGRAVPRRRARLATADAAAPVGV